MDTLTPNLPPVRHSHRAKSTRRRKRRVFLWVFAVIQVLFLAWAISAMVGGTDGHAEAVAWCHAHMAGMPTGDCVANYANGYQVGTALGTGFLVIIWAAVDIIMGITYLVIRRR